MIEIFFMIVGYHTFSLKSRMKYVQKIYTNAADVYVDKAKLAQHF